MFVLAHVVGNSSEIVKAGDKKNSKVVERVGMHAFR